MLIAAYSPDEMPKQSAGLLMYRRTGQELKFLLVHPGGPFWKSKDAGAWTIPKGEINSGEEPLTAARREFQEELGVAATGPFIELTPIKQKAGKLVHAWAFEGDFDPAGIVSDTFEIEWPPKSGRLVKFPEVDQARWFDLNEARQKVNLAQIGFLREITEKLTSTG